MADFARRLTRGFWSIVLVYAAVGSTWILVTDYLVARTFDFSNEARRIEVAKGLFYVFATATLLLLLLMRLRRILIRSLEDRFMVRQRLTAITDSPLLGIAVWTADGRVLEANDTFLRLWGYDRSEFEAGPLGFDRLSPPENLERDRECLIRAVQEGIPGPYVKELLRKDGTRLPVLTGVTAKGPGAQEGLLFIVDDSERRQATAALEELLQDLEERVSQRTRDLSLAISDLEAFGYSVSHDLRAPLRSIDGMASLIEAEAESESTKTAAIRVRENVRRMSAIIDSLIRLANVSRKPLVRENVDLAAIARDVARDLTAATGWTPELQMPEHLVVQGDQDLLRIAMRNLLENAWKFTEGRLAPRIELAHSNDTISIRDNGHGFEPGASSQIFRPFSQGSHRPDVEGSGIGLAIVERIVRGHGWTIEGRGEPGVGAEFLIHTSGTQSGTSEV